MKSIPFTPTHQLTHSTQSIAHFIPLPTVNQQQHGSHHQEIINQGAQENEDRSGDRDCDRSEEISGESLNVEILCSPASSNGGDDDDGSPLFQSSLLSTRLSALLLSLHLSLSHSPLLCFLPRLPSPPLISLVHSSLPSCNDSVRRQRRHRMKTQPQPHQVQTMQPFQ